MRRAGFIAAGVAVALAVAGVAGWLVAFRDTASPVGVDDAIESFRGETGTGQSPIPEGVYVYETRGYEKTDALNGVMHRYPRRSTITIAATDCGLRLTWRVLEGRSTAWTYCVTDEGWELRSQDERHTFFGRTERTTYLCTATFIKPAEPLSEIRAGLVDCDTDDTHEEGHVVALGSPTVRVGADTRKTIGVRKTTTFAGASRGNARYDLWFDSETGLPVRLRLASNTTSASPIGEVGYEEDVTLTLLSLEPRR